PLQRGMDNTTWNVDDFFGVTRFLLRQAKGAILSLVAAVNVEERRRREAMIDPGRIVIPTPLFVRKPISARAVDEEKEDEKLPLNDLPSR
ncbi:MAG TPA: hypothetical protein VGC93_06560, partial [Thermoanaerobaculia bacterium]